MSLKKKRMWRVVTQFRMKYFAKAVNVLTYCVTANTCAKTAVHVGWELDITRHKHELL
jgi:hypothetical protein